MGFKSTVIEDSLNEVGVRLTTMEVVFPRFILAEFNTHRMFSRNASSSRAIPLKKIIEQVEENPFIPRTFWKNQSGMTSSEPLENQDRAKELWLESRDNAVKSAVYLHALGLHKQQVNRLLEPWMWATVVVTATEWDNFFSLRCHTDAQPEFKEIATLMKEAMGNSTPIERTVHLPFITYQESVDTENSYDMICVSIARCARTSYLSGKDYSINDDVELFSRLIQSEPPHLSPFEHVAFSRGDSKFSDIHGNYTTNFRGWTQYRKLLP